MYLAKRRPKYPPELAHRLPATAALSPRLRRRRARIRKSTKSIESIIAAGALPGRDDFPRHWRHYRQLLCDAQHGKCAYCESPVRASYPGDVEHYRPKTAITRVRHRGKKFHEETPSKPGYWWLAYRFENFLFICFRCNSRKGTRFPVRGRARAVKPGIESRERPYLLNPYVNKPAQHFEFDEIGGVLGLTQEGRFTVHVCGLGRDGLVLDRERHAECILRDIDDHEDALVARNELARRQTLRRLFDACRSKEPYAALARALVKRRLGLSYGELLKAKRAGLF
jgi:5-methylcytosine-specific restriction endonuclease McrA